MYIRKVSLAILSIAALAPVVASASSEQVALNACAKAFASSIAGTSVPSFKLNYSDKHETSPIMDFYTHNYSFTLNAMDPKTGTALASATCFADTHGEVLRLTRANATVAAR